MWVEYELPKTNFSCKTEIFGNDSDKHCLIANEIKKRQRMRMHKLEEVGLPQNLAPMLQASVEQ